MFNANNVWIKKSRCFYTLWDVFVMKCVIEGADFGISERSDSLLINSVL